MKSLLAIFALLFTLNFVQANVKVYKTYKDYIDSNGVEYDSYHSWSESLGFLKITFIKGDEKEKVSCKDIWGFTIGDKLFRVDKETTGENVKNSLAYLVSKGEICYYENGVAYLEMVRKGSDNGTAYFGFLNYFSKNLEEDMYPLPHGVSEAGRRLKNFKKENPQYSELFDCIGERAGKEHFEHIRTCVEEFEKK